MGDMGREGQAAVHERPYVYDATQMAMGNNFLPQFDLILFLQEGETLIIFLQLIGGALYFYSLNLASDIQRIRMLCTASSMHSCYPPHSKKSNAYIFVVTVGPALLAAILASNLNISNCKCACS